MAKKIYNQLDIIERVDKMIEQSESEVDELLAKRLREILESLNMMYNKFVVDDKSSYTDLNKYNRLSKELKRIAEQLNADYKAIAKMIERSTERIYVEQYLMTAYLNEVYQSTKLGFSLPTEATIGAAIANPIEYLRLPNVLKEHRNEIIRKLHIEISSSLLAGEGYWKMAKRIEKAVGFSQYKARSVARTEGGRARSLSDQAVTEEMKQYAKIEDVWLSSLDHRVRTAHRKLDGQTADEEGYFHYKGLKAKGPHLWNVAKMDINCRCVKLKLVNGQLPSVRRGRDYKDDNYQQKLADRIDLYMEDGYTYAQAYKMADKEILPPSTTMPFIGFDDWRRKYGV